MLGRSNIKGLVHPKIKSSSCCSKLVISFELNPLKHTENEWGLQTSSCKRCIKVAHMIFRCKKQAICHWKSQFNTASCFNWFAIVYKGHLNVKVSVCMFDASKKINANLQLYNTTNHYYFNNSVKLDPSVRFNMFLSSNSSNSQQLVNFSTVHHSYEC